MESRRIASPGRRLPPDSIYTPIDKTSGTHVDAHVTLSMPGEDCIKLLNGQLSGQAIFMSGRLQISGDLGLAMQLKWLFPSLG